MLAQLESVASVHSHFAKWERAKQRALTISIIGFPDGHPLRRAVDSICSDVEECRYTAESCLADFTQKHGPLRCIVNVFFSLGVFGCGW